MQINPAAVAEQEPAGHDLGPLAWVLEELKKSLDGATKAMRRFVRDAELARGSEMADLDASHLRIARQQLHQAVGALEMVGFSAPAKVMRVMESLAQSFVQRPELCSDDAANKMERASFALADYLESVLKGKSVSPVALFAQYRDVAEMVDGERLHPADLWSFDWQWLSLEIPVQGEATTYTLTVRSQLDQGILSLVKSADKTAALGLRDLSLGLGRSQAQLEARTFWFLAAGFFEAIALGLCTLNVYAKRTASQVLQQYVSLAKGDPSISERLAQDLLFFCAHANPGADISVPALTAVREAYKLTAQRAVNYEAQQFGKFDPALLLQMRKRVATATETWSALAGGDTNRLQLVAEQFSAVCDSMLKIVPENGDLARALGHAVEVTVRTAEPPTTPVAMEVATAVLYLEAVIDDLDPSDPQMAARSQRLAKRLEQVSSGGGSEPLESWMEDLYRRVSDRQTMGSVVDELRGKLGEIEKSLDQFFRNPADRRPLQEIPSQMSQMRGVFSVLGLDQASTAMLRMRDSVEKLLTTTVAPGDNSTFEKLGSSLGAMGFLIDMLSYQRAMAKKVFVWDDATSEFKPLMGRAKSVESQSAAARQESSTLIEEAGAVPTPNAVVVQPTTAAAPASTELRDADAEILEIFLEEANEVVQNGHMAIQALTADPSNLADQTTLRRVFHTLKGSSRMVGLNEFGEAAWALEQLLNAWLADQKSASQSLISLSSDALRGLGLWVGHIAARTDSSWSSANFRAAADALRLENRLVPLNYSENSAGPRSAEPVAPTLAQTPAPPVSGWPSGMAQSLDAPATVLLDREGNVDHAPPDFQPTAIFVAAVHRPASAEASASVGSHLDAFDFAPTGIIDTGTRSSLAPVSVSAFKPSEPAAFVPAPALPDDSVKIIGSLRIGIPLYNVFLNEADEWSRRLQIELGEWALEWHRPLPESPIALAHSLAGSSATVGFVALSEVARSLESCMQHVQLHHAGNDKHAQVFAAAAEDIRHLLHQFAAGFLKEPDSQVLSALKAVAKADFEAQVSRSDRLDTAHTTTPHSDPVALPAAKLTLAPAAALAAVPEDDIDCEDALDADLFPIFDEEAQELLPQLGGALRQWAARPENLEARSEALRVLHTLKGSARLAGALRLGEMTHRLESDIERIGIESIPPDLLEPLLVQFDKAQACFEALRAQPDDKFVLPESPPSAAFAPENSDGLQETIHSASPGLKPSPAATALVPARQAGGQSVRVRAQLLDRLVNGAGEVMISRSRLQARSDQVRTSITDLTGNLDRMRHHLRDIEVQAESQMQSRMAQAKETAQQFDPLEFDQFTRLQELTRMLAESVNDVATVQRTLQRTAEGTEDDLIAQGRQARELQRDLLRTRMVEFESISERLYGVVRQASKDAGKQVKLNISGGALDVDRGVLERLAPAFEHLLRNSIVHGIEATENRIQAGKSAAGAIEIELQHQGNELSVDISDDGAGLNLVRIREKAIASGAAPQAGSLSDAEAAELIFLPGFSTASSVTELAGRGIGMDVVRSEMNALGGRIEIHTASGKGTRFRLVLPLTTAVTQVVMLRFGERVIGTPANIVEIVRRVPVAELEQAYAAGNFRHAQEDIPFFWAGALLQASALSSELQAKHLPVAIFRSAGQRVAVHVDEVLGNQEVVVKNLGPQLSRLPGLTGMSVLASGAVVLIYNPVALVQVYGARVLASQRNAALPNTTEGQSTGSTTAPPHLARITLAPLILVVDDSITVRRVTQRLLKREGYRVALAADGLQALEQLRDEKPVVVLSDIEMPRMDGFDLARNIRADAIYKDLPIIMITSRIAEKHREHARELGVDHYLGKPYSEDELLRLVRQYCTKVAEAEV